MKKKTNPLIRKSALLFAVLLFSFLQNGRCEILQLKNGNAIETKILKENEKFVTVQAPGGEVKIPKSDIQTIWRGGKEELLEVRGRQVFFAKGMELYKEGRFQDAADAFEKSIVSGAENALIYANLGSAYASVGEIKKAEANFLKALGEKPNNLDTLLNLAHLYETSKNYKAAVSYYQKIITLKPDASDVKRNMAYCLYMSGDYLGAAKFFEEVNKNNDVVAACNAAAAYIQAGELDKGDMILEPLIKNSSAISRVYLYKAEILRLRKNYSQAETQYHEALSRDPKDPRISFGFGLLYLDIKEWSMAEAAFNEALAKDPASLGAVRGLAQVFIQKGEYQKAIAQYEQLAKKDPDNLAIASSIGLVYVKMNQPKDALEIFQKILSKNDLDAKAHTNAGLAYALMPDVNNALKEWNRALELDPKLESALRDKKLLEEVMQGNKNEKSPTA